MSASPDDSLFVADEPALAREDAAAPATAPVAAPPAAPSAESESAAVTTLAATAPASVASSPLAATASESAPTSAATYVPAQSGSTDVSGPSTRGFQSAPASPQPAGPAEVAAVSPQTASPPAPAPDALAALARIDARLEQIRQLLDSNARESQHQEFSLARLFGSIAQALVIGLLGAATFDWIFDGTFEQIVTKLAFAAVLQVAALSAFVLTRRA